MANKTKFSTITLWIARVLGALTIAALFIAMYGDISGFNDNKELLVFFCFPVLVQLGLLLAFKWKGFGGFLSVLGMIGLHIFRNDLIESPIMNAFAIPGLLYIIYAVWSK
jgi:glycerol uptake facilitator-like aquaporin